MAGQVFKRCTRCPTRSRYRDADRRCPTCGKTSHSWCFRAELGRTPAGQRRMKKKGGFKTRREAERAMRDLLTEVDRGRIIEPTRATVGNFLVEHWLPSIAMTIEATTLEGYRGVVQRYVGSS
jgi:integrase